MSNSLCNQEGSVTQCLLRLPVNVNVCVREPESDFVDLRQSERKRELLWFVDTSTRGTVVFFNIMCAWI